MERKREVLRARMETEEKKGEKKGVAKKKKENRENRKWGRGGKIHTAGTDGRG